MDCFSYSVIVPALNAGVVIVLALNVGIIIVLALIVTVIDEPSQTRRYIVPESAYTCSDYSFPPTFVE